MNEHPEQQNAPQSERPGVVNVTAPKPTESQTGQAGIPSPLIQPPPGAVPPIPHAISDSAPNIHPVPPVDCTNLSTDPNSIEYWKQLAYLNGESCRDVVDTLAKVQAELRNAKKAQEKAEEALIRERNSKAVVVPNNLIDLLTHCTTGKIQSITLYFQTKNDGD